MKNEFRMHTSITVNDFDLNLEAWIWVCVYYIGGLVGELNWNACFAWNLKLLNKLNMDKFALTKCAECCSRPVKENVQIKILTNGFAQLYSLDILLPSNKFIETSLRRHYPVNHRP